MGPIDMHYRAFLLIAQNMVLFSQVNSWKHLNIIHHRLVLPCLVRLWEQAKQMIDCQLLSMKHLQDTVEINKPAPSLQPHMTTFWTQQQPIKTENNCRISGGFTEVVITVNYRHLKSPSACTHKHTRLSLQTSLPLIISCTVCSPDIVLKAYKTHPACNKTLNTCVEPFVLWKVAALNHRCFQCCLK